MKFEQFSSSQKRDTPCNAQFQFRNFLTKLTFNRPKYFINASLLSVYVETSFEKIDQ